MRAARRFAWVQIAVGCCAALISGCVFSHAVPEIPGPSAPPAALGPVDATTSGALGQAAESPATSSPKVALAPSAEAKQPQLPAPRLSEPSPASKAFLLPPRLPGADAPPIRVPRFDKETPAERDKVIRALYPALPPAAEEVRPILPPGGKPWTLADLQALALQNSPAIRRAQQEVEASRGAMIQAGLYPNPTVGYAGDQIQPGNKPSNSAGQQGGFIDQVIKTAGKLQLARLVASIDYLNAEVALRRAQVDLINQVRGRYFSVLVTQEGMAVNRALAELADEVYRLQLRQVGGGEAAGYEPLQLYAQAVQARNTLLQAQTRYRAAWRQLAASLATPELPPQLLAGRADTVPPQYDLERAKAQLVAGHTDLLTARNAIVQAQYSLRLAQVVPIPDIQTHTAIQHDNADGNNQFSLQVGVELPVWNRNQGNIYQARAQLARAMEDLHARQNDLLSQLAEVFGRYEFNRALTANYRERILPNLARAYRAIYQRYQQEPDKVGFGDVVVAQQNYAAALNSYLGALGDQWTAVVDLANLMQIDELYVPEPVPAKDPSIPPIPKK
jgi:outer membrane protein, heavy metal efflux system